MCADVCVHDKGDGNPHAHVMLTMRPMEQDGSWGAKSKKEYILDNNGQRIVLKSGAYKTRKVDAVDWNDRARAEEWREGWAEAVNRFLEQNNHAERIDHRSYERQGVEQIPTVHLGVAAFQMERRGIATERGNLNRQIEISNQEIRMLRARINKLEKWLADEPQTAAPNLQDVFAAILSGGEDKTRYRKITDLKTAAKVLAFLQTNGITELSQLQETVSDMRGRFNSVSDKLKKTERRLNTLDEHIRNGENYRKHRAIYQQYQNEKPKKRDAFYQAHASGIILYEAAKKYLDAHLNGHTLPLKAWKSERARLAAEKENLYQNFYRLRDEVREVEVIRYNAERAISTDEQKLTVTKDRGAEL